MLRSSHDACGCSTQTTSIINLKRSTLHPTKGKPTGRIPHLTPRCAFSVQAMHPIKDKRARLRVAARYIKMGIVKFPRHGCDQLLTQLLGFGVEKHYDGVDALVYL